MVSCFFLSSLLTMANTVSQSVSSQSVGARKKEWPKANQCWQQGEIRGVYQYVNPCIVEPLSNCLSAYLELGAMRSGGSSCESQNRTVYLYNCLFA